MFEAQINQLYTMSMQFQGAIDKKVKPQLDSVEKNWANPESKFKNGIDKANVLRMIESKRFEISLRRRALLNLEWITREEFDLLEFCWWLRNCMHNDFSALSNKEFTFFDSEVNETYNLTFHQGEIISCFIYFF